MSANLPLPPPPAGRRRLTREQRQAADRVLERLKGHQRIEADPAHPERWEGKSGFDLEIDMGLVGQRPRVEWLLVRLVEEGAVEVGARKTWPGTNRTRVLYRPKGKPTDGNEKK